MTQDEYNQALEDPKTTVEAPASSEDGGSSAPSPSSAAPSTSINEFLPALTAAQSTQQYLSAAPTFIPQTFQDQIQFVFDGTNYSVYFYFNNQWNQMKIVNQSPWSSLSGTDSAGVTQAVGTVTHTITHGLGRPPSIIIVNSMLTPNGVAGSSVNLGIAVGTIMLNGAGVPIGGSSVSAQMLNVGGSTGINGQTMKYVSMQAGVNNITAQTSDSGGTEIMTITVQNVTMTSFDIVYSVSAPTTLAGVTQAFAVDWTVMG